MTDDSAQVACEALFKVSGATFSRRDFDSWLSCLPEDVMFTLPTTQSSDIRATWWKERTSPLVPMEDVEVGEGESEESDDTNTVPSTIELTYWAHACSESRQSVKLPWSRMQCASCQTRRPDVRIDGQVAVVYPPGDPRAMSESELWKKLSNEIPESFWGVNVWSHERNLGPVLGRLDVADRKRIYMRAIMDYQKLMKQPMTDHG